MHIAKGISEWEIRWEEAIEKDQVAVEWSSEWMIIAYYGEAHKSSGRAHNKNIFLCIFWCRGSLQNPLFVKRVLPDFTSYVSQRALSRTLFSLLCNHSLLPRSAAWCCAIKRHFSEAWSAILGVVFSLKAYSRHHWVASICKRILEQSEKKYFAPLLVVFNWYFPVWCQSFPPSSK